MKFSLHTVYIYKLFYKLLRLPLSIYIYLIIFFEHVNSRAKMPEASESIKDMQIEFIFHLSQTEVYSSVLHN